MTPAVPSTQTLQTLHDALQPDGTISSDARTFTFHWNEGPGGQAYTWDGLSLTAAPGTPHAEPTNTRWGNVERVSRFQSVDANTGQPSSVIALERRTMTFTLTAEALSVSLARVLTTYLTSCEHQGQFGVPTARLTVIVGENQEHLTFTPRPAPRTATRTTTPAVWLLRVGHNRQHGGTLDPSRRQQLAAHLNDMISETRTVTPDSLRLFRRLKDLTDERRGISRTRHLWISLQFSPQQVRLYRVPNDFPTTFVCDTPPMTTLKLSYPDVQPRRAHVTHPATPEPHPGGPRLTWQDEHGRPGHLPIDPELSLILTELIPEWLAGHDHELEFSPRGAPAPSGSSRFPGSAPPPDTDNRWLLEFALAPDTSRPNGDGTYAPAEPAELYVKVRTSIDSQTMVILALDHSEMRHLHRATFALNRRTLSGGQP